MKFSYNLLSLFTCNKNIEHKTTTYLGEKIFFRVRFGNISFMLLCFMLVALCIDAYKTQEIS